MAQPPTEQKEKPVERKRFESGIDIELATRQATQPKEEEVKAEEPKAEEPPAAPAPPQE